MGRAICGAKAPAIGTGWLAGQTMNAGRVEIYAETGKDEAGQEHLLLMESDANRRQRAVYRYQLGINDDELHGLFVDAAKLLARNPLGQANAVLGSDNKWRVVLVDPRR